MTGATINRRDLLAIGAAGTVARPLKVAAQTSGTASNEPGPYDLVIEGGRVLDPESGFDAVANIGIIGGRIAAISDQPMDGAATLQATGQVVSPGFIDLHSHGMQLPGAWVQAFDGVTTALELESGLFPVGMAYERIAAEGRPINYGLGVAWTFARVMVFQPEAGEPDGTLGWFQKAFGFSGWQNAIPVPEQLESIIDLMDSGLKEGGLCVSINAGYAPGMGRKEYYELSNLAKKHGVATFTHDRYMSIVEPQSSFEALVEQIGLGAATGAHMHICHINSVAGRDLEAATRLVREAQENGVRVTVEAYPYGAFSTAVGADFMRGPEWLSHFGAEDYSAMELRGQPLTKGKIEELQASAPGEIVIFHFLREDSVERDMELLDLAVLYPGGAIASDAMPWMDAKGAIVEGNVWPLPGDSFAHPRTTGCFSRFLSKWVRERQAISLTDALAKCTLIPARILEEAVPQMKSKGRLQIGCDADIVVFDPDTVEDKATFVAPTQLSVGFRHVIVNGTPIIRDGTRLGGARPGQAIRRNV
ncbi:amidohydrolase family protein [Salipiger mangrovisoli]|uniref:Amidohydrolase family protein n=1 Tax=Salipiger mangrovisoli TaxID=2865933 RepID=A0ABR9WYB3_9RHOB|nr:amidohydrolase family protein [Salipiger mangrovisoli]MBE9636300.1 amidohydrolase family protein [Salipiger mangrovisoli]